MQDAVALRLLYTFRNDHYYNIISIGISAENCILQDGFLFEVGEKEKMLSLAIRLLSGYNDPDIISGGAYEQTQL